MKNKEKLINGTIFAMAIEPKIRRVSDEAKKQNLSNVNSMLRDFMADGSGIEDESMHYVMLFNILHMENPTSLLAEARRILKKVV